MRQQTRWDLHLRSPKGVLTYEGKQGMSPGTTFDLVWMNYQADELIVVCLVDAKDTINHHSDHKDIVTVININSDDVICPETNNTSDRSWHKVDHNNFYKELKALLPHNLPSPLSSHADIISFLINFCSPQSQQHSTSHHHSRITCSNIKHGGTQPC